MMTLSIALDRKLSLWVKQVKDGLGPVLEAATKDTTAYGKGLIVRSTAKGATGMTQGGWNSAREGVARWKIWNRFKHALYLEHGTGLYRPAEFGGAHMITSPTGGLMRWRNWAKNTVTGWTSKYETKGMPAQPAIEPNVDKIQKDLNVRVRSYIRRLFKAVHR